MIYISLDTCVWLEIIKVNPHNDNNVFEELCFWIENGHLIHIVPENVIREWDRNKANKLVEVIRDSQVLIRNATSAFRGSPELISAFEPNAIEEVLTRRVDRIDTILKTNSERANESESIYQESVKRSLGCLAPNHKNDSFRDTVNIITLIEHIKEKGYTDCLFSTINYTDFSEAKDKKHELHNQLIKDFASVSLEYVFCDGEPFGNKLFGVNLRPKLPSYQDYLKSKKEEQKEKILAERKRESSLSIQNPDSEFLENIRYIDDVLSKEKPTDFDMSVIKDLIGRHESYKQYFFNKVGDNGLV